MNPIPYMYIYIYIFFTYEKRGGLTVTQGQTCFQVLTDTQSHRLLRLRHPDQRRTNLCQISC